MKLALVNQSKRVTAGDLTRIRAVLGLQATDFAKSWGFLKAAFTAHPSADATTLLIIDNPDMAGALGYHSVDPQGRPYGRIFVDPVLDNGGSVLGDRGDPSLSVSAVCSHEALEWWLDPFCQLWADQGRKSIAYEVCDPVEQDSYLINGVAVSNFVLPGWFNADDQTGKVDHLGKLSKPFTMTPGGYWVEMADGISKQVFQSTRAEFAQSSAARVLAGTKHYPASRTYRRLHAQPDS